MSASIALGAGALRMLTLPLVPEAQAAPAEISAPGRVSAASSSAAVSGDADVNATVPKEQLSAHSDRNVGSDSHELSPAQAITLVQRRYHARVVRTRMQTDASGRQLYVFRLLSAAGRVWTVRIDAHSGAEVQ